MLCCSLFLVFGQERICQLAHWHKQGSDTKSLERPEKGNFFRPVWEAHLRAEGRVVRRGSSIGFVECEITDDRGQLIAKASSTCMALKGDRAKGR